MSLGKAAVYKHIPVYYPNHVGAVGGLVGMIGGLGGFVLPIAFGVLNDLTASGRAASCCCSLIVGGRADLDAPRHPADGAGSAGEPSLSKLPELPEMQPIHGPEHVGALAGAHADRGLAARGQGVLGRRRGGPSPGATCWISIPALLLSFAVWMVWSVVVAKLPAIGFKFTTDQLFWLAALPGLSGATLRIFYSFMVPIFGGRLWTTLATWSLMIPAVGIGYAVQNPDTPYLAASSRSRCCAASAAATSPPRWPNISLLLPEGARRATRWRSMPASAISASASCSSSCRSSSPPACSAGSAANRSHREGTGGTCRSGCRTPASSGCRSSQPRAFAAWFGMNDIASAKASFAEQAVIFQRKHNWIMCWLYTGTFGSFIGYSAGFPLLAKTQFPEVDALQLAFLGPLVGALARSVTGWVAGQVRRRPRHLLGVRR